MTTLNDPSNAAAKASDGDRPKITTPPHADPELSRRAFLRGAGLAAAGLTMAGCGLAPAATPTRSGQKVQLVYQDWATGWFPPMAQQALEEFHASHPNIRVYYVPDPENATYEAKVLADMQAGTMADVFQGCCTHFPIWAQKGYTLDLRPYVAADLDKETIADWDPAQYQAFFTRDGRQFGLPKYHGALALYYNKDIFRQAKVGFPNQNWNHTDYLSAMKQLASPMVGRPRERWGSMLEVIWDRVQVHVNAFGGHYVDPKDPRHSLMGEAAALAAFQWLRDCIWEYHVMPTSAEVQTMGTREAFVAGKVAMVEDGSWALKDVLSEAPFEVGIAPFPTGPMRRATLATTDGFGIYSGTKHPDAAWELIKFLTGKSYGRAMAKAAFLQPARASLVDEWVSFVRAEFPEKARDVDIAAFAHGHINGYSVTTEVFENMAAATQLVDTAWERIFTFGDLPVDHMIDVSRQVELAQKTALLPEGQMAGQVCATCSAVP
jgi:multiple sugar transport system substrate-binding protein